MVNDWYLYSNPERSWIERYASVPGFRWNWRNKVCVSVGWHISHTPLMPESELARLRALNGPPVLTWPRSLIDKRIVLRDYQNDDRPFIAARRASIIGYEMRLGKTALATVAHNPSDGPLIIVAPLIARDVWMDWCARVHGFQPFMCTGRDAYDTRAFTPTLFPAYFVHYDILDAWAGVLANYNPATLILDECHLLQARRSKRISAASLIAVNAKRTIGLSGTPMWSNPRSMWPILNLLSPGAWGTEFDFSQRYTNATPGAYGWKYEGINNNVELTQRLQHVIVRRTWESVLGQLPPVTNVVEPVELSNSERIKYESLATRAQLERLAAGVQSSVAGYNSSLRQLFGYAKVPRTVELVRQAIADKHKVVVWTWHNNVADAIHKELGFLEGNVYHIRADDAQDFRNQEIRNFQECANTAVMLISLAIGGVAIDLSSADLNIFTEMDWIPATNYQAAMRIFKPSRASSNVWLFADTAIERRLVEVLGCHESCQAQAGLGYTEVAAEILKGAGVEQWR